MTHFQIQKRPSKLQKNHRKSLYLIFTAIIVRRTFSNILTFAPKIVKNRHTTSLAMLYNETF